MKWKSPGFKFLLEKLSATEGKYYAEAPVFSRGIAITEHDKRVHACVLEFMEYELDLHEKLRYRHECRRRLSRAISFIYAIWAKWHKLFCKSQHCPLR